MDIYLLAFNIIIADKLLGGVPSKIIEHIIINNVLAVSWWGVSKILYGAGYLAMLPFTTNSSQQSTESYSLVDAAFYNEYVIQQCNIPINDSATTLTNDGKNKQTPSINNISEWEIVNKDDSKIILTNNKTSKQIIISKSEIDDIVVLNKD